VTSHTSDTASHISDATGWGGGHDESSAEKRREKMEQKMELDVEMEGEDKLSWSPLQESFESSNRVQTSDNGKLMVPLTHWSVTLACRI